MKITDIFCYSQFPAFQQTPPLLDEKFYFTNSTGMRLISASPYSQEPELESSMTRLARAEKLEVLLIIMRNGKNEAFSAERNEVSGLYRQILIITFFFAVLLHSPLFSQHCINTPADLSKAPEPENEISPVVSMLKDARATEIKVYPNPNEGHFTIEIPFMDEGSEIRIMNPTGKILHAEKIAGTDIRKDIYLNAYNAGVYFLMINLGDKIHTEKIIVR